MRKLKRIVIGLLIVGIVCFVSENVDAISDKIHTVSAKASESMEELKDVDLMEVEISDLIPEESSDNQDPNSSIPETVEIPVETYLIESSDNSDITVTFVDVGQGDSIIIHDNGETMIIDTGKSEGMDNINAVLAEQGIDDVDTLLLTHPDADHIQNAPEIITKYEVDQVYMPVIETDTGVYQNLMTVMNLFGIAACFPEAGDTIDFGTANYEIVGPVNDEMDVYSDTNSYSLIVRMTNGEDSFLFTGDATGEETEDILAAGFDVSADVYKSAHHGSANEGCNSEAFFNAIDPETVVVSCGYHNDYGHPHVETMDLVQKFGCSLFRTDLQGTISCLSTGTGILWSQEPTTVYTNGNNL